MKQLPKTCMRTPLSASLSLHKSSLNSYCHQDHFFVLWKFFTSLLPEKGDMFNGNPENYFTNKTPPYKNITSEKDCFHSLL